MNVWIDSISLNRLLSFISDTIKLNRKTILSYVNIHAINLAAFDPTFLNFFNSSDLVFCDGFGVRLGARLLGQSIPYRYTPPDWIGELCQLCVYNGFSLYFLGARPRVAEKAAQKLRAQVPDVNITGTFHGYFNKEPGSPENEAVIAEINCLKPDILMVGFGMPIQERWLMENWERIDAHVAIPVGAMFDYVAGEIRRAPRWMTDHGLEWLGRLIIEPRRLWRRYLIGNALFFYRILRQRFTQGDQSDLQNLQIHDNH